MSDEPRSKLDSRNEVPSHSDSLEAETPRYLTRADAFNSVFQGVGTAAAQPREQLVKNVTGTMVVLVHPSQSGNPMLHHMQNVLPEVNADITADYMMGDTCAAYFISVRYHMLHPHYLKNKLARATRVKVQVLVCHVDVSDSESALKEINCEALKAARYIETLKAYENKSAALIKEKVEGDFNSQLIDVLTTVRSVNKTDGMCDTASATLPLTPCLVLTLSGSFGSLRRIMNATEEELALCPGIGGKKVQQLLEAFNQPFHS
ncbi:hypothetical protein B5M09_001189 [Aphanomyces astaci]|uniref:ERCC1-like central domain-containing protein n=1 Tax=Aphanomyces astaci TaxID=112090 RepID=A0A3R7WGW4_APHAT|nr:hypothetical protein B5M09_001189 [Aphanomyces astaci]